MTMNRNRADGAVITAATGLALVFMLHHPTSFAPGDDDGRLLADWNNGLVHAGMIGCLMALHLGLQGVRRLLGPDHLLTRAGALLLGVGFAAAAGAAVINGLATARLLAEASNPIVEQAGLRAFWALNQSLTGLGLMLIAIAAAAWAPGLWRQGVAGRLAAGLGVALFALTLWHTTTDGRFDLHVAVVAMAAFALWSLSVAAAMIMARPEGETE